MIRHRYVPVTGTVRTTNEGTASSMWMAETLQLTTYSIERTSTIRVVASTTLLPVLTLPQHVTCRHEIIIFRSVVANDKYIVMMMMIDDDDKSMILRTTRMR